MSVRGVDRLALDLLGGHVLGRAHHEARLGEVGVLGRLGDAEVGHLHPPVAGEQDVGRLDVAVDEPGPVGGVERLGDLGGEAGGLPRVDRRRVVEALAQRLARAPAPSRSPRCRPPSRCRRSTRSPGGRGGPRPPPPGGSAATKLPSAARCGWSSLTATLRRSTSSVPCHTWAIPPDATSSSSRYRSASSRPASTMRARAGAAVTGVPRGGVGVDTARRGYPPAPARIRRAQAPTAAATQVTPMTRGPAVGADHGADVARRGSGRAGTAGRGGRASRPPRGRGRG